MNERIRELCIQSGAYEHYEVNEVVNGDDLPMQRFAELIVKDCIIVMMKNDYHGEWLGEKLKQHFGMK